MREKLVVVRGFLLESAEEMKAGLKEGVEIARGEHFRLGEMYQDLEQRSFGARRSNGEFIAAAREYQIGVETLREFKRKIEQRRIDSSVADPVITQIHEHAEPDDHASGEATNPQKRQLLRPVRMLFEPAEQQLVLQ